MTNWKLRSQHHFFIIALHNVFICPFPPHVNTLKCVLSTRKMQNVSDRGRARSVSAATPRGNELLAVRYGEPGAIF